MNGTIKSLNAEKRYGFIKTVDGTDEYFFHQDGFGDDWATLVFDFNTMGRNKINVTFKSTESNKGLRAAEVKRV